VNRRIRGTNLTPLVLATCVLVIILIGEPVTIPRALRPWNPTIAPGVLVAAYRDVQQWAKSNTSQDAKFLVPPSPDGFRIFSERVCVGEWKDGEIIYTFPAFAGEWRRRIGVVGMQILAGQASWGYKEKMILQEYKEQSWEHLLAVARENHIDYVVQYAERPYDIPSVFRNKEFAV